jgi:hypothetical protein
MRSSQRGGVFHSYFPVVNRGDLIHYAAMGNGPPQTIVGEAPASRGDK